jgi:gamma-glutamylcyclotransferase (GGCT)/AIG2-like uncharacterized protein YtfP
MNEYLFSYGTLRADRVQIQLFGRLLNGTADALMGYKIALIEIKDKAFLAKGEEKIQGIAIPSDDTNDMVEGKVFEVSETELLHADKYEPDGYERRKVELKSGKMAWMYLANSK